MPPYDKPLTSLHWLGHVQSVVRIPGVEDDDWMVVVRSHANGSGRAGFFLVKMSGLAGDAAPPRQVFAGPHLSMPATDATAFFYPMGDTDHPSGAQMIGRTLLVGAECAQDEACAGISYVEAYDLSQPGAARRLHRLALDGSQGEPWQQAPGENNGYASTSSIVRLADGRYLMFVTGKTHRQHGWFYVSERPSLNASTRWHYQQAWDAAVDALPEPGVWDGDYQNMSFVTECGTGDVYLVGMGNAHYRGPFGAGEDVLHLYKLEGSLDSRLSLRRREVRTLSTPDCTLRAGSSVHVTPQGGMALYCSAHHSPFRFWLPGDELTFAEYAARDAGD